VLKKDQVENKTADVDVLNSLILMCIYCSLKLYSVDCDC